jgi:YidC/Oxa1 family membrane protein insertase
MRPTKEQETPLAEFKNPNAGGGGSQDSRSFLVMMIVMIGVIFGLQYWRGQHNPPTAPPDQPSATAPSSPAAAAHVPEAGHGAPGSAMVPAVAAAAESSTVVENSLYKIIFSNRGGQVSSWILKKYKDNQGHPLDLVHDGAAARFGYPLSLYTYDAALTKQLADALYVPSATGALTAPATLRFDYAAGDLVVHKTFTFGSDYVLHADSVVLRNGAPIRALLAWPAGFGDMETLGAYGGAQLDTSSNGHDDHTAVKKVSGGATLNGPFDFAGSSDQYFAAIFLPDQPASATLATLHNQMYVHNVAVGASAHRHDGPPLFPAKENSLVPLLGAAVGNLSGHDQMRLFVGPKDLDVLKSIHTANGGTLEPVVDFGWTGYIGKGLFLVLHAVHSWLPNANEATSVPHNFSWGWAIVLVTVLINLVILPLRIKGMKSTIAMQRIQPGIDAIKAKYKNPKPTDPKAAEMNAEVMAYQKEKGVSMFGGCIPSLIQLPLLFAFFSMIQHVVELRHAHFYWLPDLSAADPYHILPIFMVITSFLVQFYTPSPGVDPQQQRMLAFMMPVMSGFWIWNYASGLGLYWGVGNIIMILQQVVMNQTSLGKEMKAIAAERAKRKAIAAKPGGRTIQGRR